MSDIILYGDRQERLNMALKFYNKSMDDLNEYLTIMKAWFKAQLHLPEVPPDELIISYLIACKFSTEATKKKLDMYYSIRSLVPDFFQDKNPKDPHMQKIFSVQYFLRLPQLTPEGCRVVVAKHFSDPATINVNDAFASAFKMLELIQYVDYAVGDIFIEDLSEIKLGHTLKITPTIIRNTFLTYFKSFPSKLKGFHFIYAPQFFDHLYSIIRGIIPPKIAERVHLHRGLEGLSEHVPLDILPSEYGGKERSLEEIHVETMKVVKEFQPRFDELENFRTDENKRTTPLVNDEFLGYYGNFRKIDVD